MSAASIWVICPDYGCEGLREPIAAFGSEQMARQALRMFEAIPGATSVKLCEVPMWLDGGDILAVQPKETDQTTPIGVAQ